MNIEQVEVRRKAFGETRITSHPALELAAGEVLARIERFALTANNVSYALTGDMIGYWKFFPVEEPWGVVPVWGFAEVVQSRCDAVPVGERVWGCGGVSGPGRGRWPESAGVGRRAFSRRPCPCLPCDGYLGPSHQLPRSRPSHGSPRPCRSRARRQRQ